MAEKDKSNGMFRDQNGSQSSMRLMAASAVGAAILMGFADLYVQATTNKNPDIDMIIFALLGAGFGGKTFQRFAEKDS